MQREYTRAVPGEWEIILLFFQNQLYSMFSLKSVFTAAVAKALQLINVSIIQRHVRVVNWSTSRSGLGQFGKFPFEPRTARSL